MPKIPTFSHNAINYNIQYNFISLMISVVYSSINDRITTVRNMYVYVSGFQTGALLLQWINLNSSMDK